MFGSCDETGNFRVFRVGQLSFGATSQNSNSSSVTDVFIYRRKRHLSTKNFMILRFFLTVVFLLTRQFNITVHELTKLTESSAKELYRKSKLNSNRIPLVVLLCFALLL